NTVQVIVVERNHPLETLQLVLLQCTAHKNRRLLCNCLLDTMSHSIVIDFLLSSAIFFFIATVNEFLILVFKVFIVTVALRLIALLLSDRVDKFLQDLVGLSKQVRDTRILGLSPTPQVGLLVVSLQGLQTLL